MSGKDGIESQMTTTTLCYIENDGKYLMLHRVKKHNDMNEGKWIGVGGHVESQESPEECLVREVKEETGLDATEVSYQFSIPNLYLYSGFMVHTLDMFYLVKVKDLSHVEAMDDAAAYYWIALDKLKPEEFGLGSIRQGLIKFLQEKVS